MARIGRSSLSNGGMFGTGVFGLFGSIVTCKAEDDSVYCQIIKMFNLLIILFIVVGIVVFVYSLVKGKSRGKSIFG